MRLKNTDKLEVINHVLFVNGDEFIIRYPDEPVACTDGNRLVTLLIKGCGISLNYWKPEEIEGFYANDTPSTSLVDI